MHALGDPLLGDCNLDEPLLVSEDKPLPYRYGDAEARGGDDEALTLRVVVSSSYAPRSTQTRLRLAPRLPLAARLLNAAWARSSLFQVALQAW